MKNPKESKRQRRLTNWRVRKEGQVRVLKESKRARAIHQLDSAERGIKSGHQKEVSERGALTFWTVHTEGKFRTPKGKPRSKRALTS